MIFAQVFPDPHSKQTATIMRPFLVKVVEGGDVYTQGEVAFDYVKQNLLPHRTTPPPRAHSYHHA